MKDHVLQNDDAGLILKALAFAAHKHRDQRRKGAEASPYINHPISLANVLWHEGDVSDAVVIAAAILHDTVEDTETSLEELEREFGKQICNIVLEVTDDQRLPPALRKRLQVLKAPHVSHMAKLVKLADKICNLRDILIHPPEGWTLERKRRYFDWARQVVDGIRGSNDKLETAFDAVYEQKP
ncbi:MAG: HD domain-containing protein [Gammaproteobacteria bacterium]|nr:HD domain-containing protein [Gammaproteobacteria bacterium]